MTEYMGVTPGTSEYAEDFIIGAWLHGEHKEHLRIFHQDNFKRRAGLFRTMKKLRNWADPIELSNATQQEGDPVSVVELVTLTKEYISTPNRDEYYRGYAKQILYNGMTDYILDYNGKDEKQVAGFIEKMKIIDASKTVKAEDTSNWLSEYLTEIDNRKDQKPLQYDIPGLNKKLGGLKRGELTTLSARPGVGKSTLALQTAEAIAKAGHKVVYFNLEMTMHQIADRLILKHTNVLQQHLMTGEITTEEGREISMALDTLTPIQENISFKRVNRNIDYYKDIIDEEKPELVIVDQLSHLTANITAQSIREKYIYMVEALKNIAIEYNIPVLLLAQLNRETTNHTEPTLEGLKESGAIEETSDNVLLLYIDKDEKDIKSEDVILPCIIKIAKNRQGEQGKVKVTFKKNKCCFTEEVWIAPRKRI